MLPASTTTVLYGLNVLGGLFRKDLALTYFPRLRNRLRNARRFEVWSGPIVNLVHGLALLGSTFGRSVFWRGIVYRLNRQGRVVGVHRRESPIEDAGQPEFDPPAANDCQPASNVPFPCLPSRVA